jgi:hypothetical protein
VVASCVGGVRSTVGRLRQFGVGLFICIAAAFGASGCISSISGAPNRLYTTAHETDFVRQVAGPEWYSTYYQSSGARKRELRDQIILSRMYAIDVLYSDYEAELTRERQNVGFYSTVANLALTSTAAATGTKETKAILAAVAAGLTGTREAYEKDVLIEKTISILQENMRTQRKLTKAHIIERLNLGVESYPLELALTDVENYYRAGTITGALIGISELSSLELAGATAKEQAATLIKFSPTDFTPRIRAYWTASAENRERVEAWLRQNNISISATAFMRSGAHAALHQKLIRDLKIP